MKLAKKLKHKPIQNLIENLFMVIQQVAVTHLQIDLQCHQEVVLEGREEKSAISREVAWVVSPIVRIIEMTEIGLGEAQIGGMKWLIDGEITLHQNQIPI